MNQVYRFSGISKQNFHQRLRRELEEEEEMAQILPIMRQIREDHPGMGARKLYHMIRPQRMNRDQFIEYYGMHGFRVKQRKNYRRTTNSNGVIRFENLLHGNELTGVNQILVSDITYYEIGERFYYLTFIMDLYSRKIKGYAASETLRTIDTTMPAMQMVLKNLPQHTRPILHSDGGGQYYCKEFLEMTKGRVRHSMCESVYENAHAERINGIIKNEYLKPAKPENYKELKRLLKRTVEKYNNQRPHAALAYQTPEEFENKAMINQQKQGLLTKEKRSKKENLYHYNVMLNMS